MPKAAPASARRPAAAPALLRGSRRRVAVAVAERLTKRSAHWLTATAPRRQVRRGDVVGAAARQRARHEVRRYRQASDRTDRTPRRSGPKTERLRRAVMPVLPRRAQCRAALECFPPRVREGTERAASAPCRAPPRAV